MGIAKSESTPLLTPTGVRIFCIVAMLRHTEIVDFKKLRSRLDVSPATIKRDLQVMRDELGMPIVWDNLKRGYRLEEPWRVVADRLYEAMGETLLPDIN